MASGSYGPVEGGGDRSPREQQQNMLSPQGTGTPRIGTPQLGGEMDLGRMSFLQQEAENRRSFTPTPMYQPTTPPMGSSGGLFSSAQAYAPVSTDNGGRPPTPGTPGSPGMLYADMYRSPSSRPWSDRGSTNRLSVASSHILNSDFGSQHQLMRYSDSGAIPMHDYDKEGGSRVSTPSGIHYMPVDHSDASTGRTPAAEKYTRSGRTPMAPRKKWMIFGAVIVGLILVAIAVAIPLILVHDRQHSGDSAPGATVPGTGPHGEVVTSGTNGSEIRMENGTIFTYVNNFGGEWRSNLTDDGARAQNYTPPLNEEWDYARDRMLGVNLGGWLVIEPFIVPSLFEPYENISTSKYVVDEYTLMQQWEKDGGVAMKEANLRQHYDTFITEYDFMMIAAAGLNWVRLPIAYWAIATMPGEPLVQGMSWEYFLKAIQWARKYGLRINLDLHAIPGSQNGYNHGGRLGVFNFLNSPLGMMSADRALDTIRVLAEFVAQPEVAKVVPLFGILNEPNLPVGIGSDNLRRFYVEAYSIVRNVTGLGAGKGPVVSYHDGFMGLPTWSGFMQGADRVAWDLHPYVCFVPPFGDRNALIPSACNGFGANTDVGLTQYGITMAGEWSLAPNDCGLYLNGPFQGVRYDGSWSGGGLQKVGECGPFDDWQNYSNATKRTMYQGAIAQMNAFHNFFFWTWKIGDSLRTGGPVNPNWSYLLGIQQGWMPKNPQAESANACADLQQQNVQGISKTALTWASSFADYQTGAAASYTPSTAAYSWPPPQITVSGSAGPTIAVTALPTYTQTGPVMVPPTPTYSLTLTQEAQPSLDPWVQGGRQTPAFVAVQGCTYPDIWTNATTVTGWPCTGGGGQRRRTPRRGLTWSSPDMLQYDDLFVRDAEPPRPALFQRAAVQPAKPTAAPRR